jgi:hypothetical protein
MLVHLAYGVCVRARERESDVWRVEREIVSERQIYIREGGRARWRKGGRERDRV